MKTQFAFLLLSTGMLACGTASSARPDAGADGSAQQADSGVDSGIPLPDAGGCGATQTITDAGIVAYQVPPACTESGIANWFEPHVAMRDPSVAASGKLVVFFPGTGLLPVDYQLVLATAVQQGYLAIGLRYANDKDVGAISDSSDPDCTKLARMEILTGNDLSSKVSVGPADSVIQRLVSLLTYLDAQHPGEGWGAFVQNGQPAWGSIGAAGHSLGGGEAALIGLQYAVARVVLFSSPNDHACGNASAPAPWEMPGTLTPPQVWFGLGHLWDSNDEPLELAAWNALNMAQFGNPSASVNIEKVSPPYEGSHELKTDATPSTCSSQATCPVQDAHRSTAVDANTPLDSNGAPHFLAAWKYLLGP